MVNIVPLFSFEVLEQSDYINAFLNNARTGIFHVDGEIQTSACLGDSYKVN
jgi:hypothetical protein